MQMDTLQIMTTRRYLRIENEEQRMVWSGLGSPLQHLLYVQELQRVVKQVECKHTATLMECNTSREFMKHIKIQQFFVVFLVIFVVFFICARTVVVIIIF